MRLSGSVDELQTLQLSSLPDDDLLGVLRELETHKRRLATADHRLIAEIESRGLAREHACKDTATLLSQLLRVTPARSRDLGNDWSCCEEQLVQPVGWGLEVEGRTWPLVEGVGDAA